MKVRSRSLLLVIWLAVAAALLIIGLLMILPTYVVRKTGELFNDHVTNLITAIATGFIAWFTLTLKQSTDKLWDESKAQRELAREEFISTHRPKLIIRQCQLEQLEVNQVIRVWCSVINIGDTSASIRGYAFEVAIWNRNHYEAPGIDFIAKKWTEPRKIIRNGERISLRWDSRLHVTNEQLGAIVSGAMHIRFVGEFTYCDDLGTERRTGFCRTYDVEADEFVASRNQDREYQD